jgi:hypothetical protein
VRGCARCTEALNEIKSVRSTMGALPMVPAPEAGLDSLFAYAEQAARRNAAGPAPAPTWWRKLVAPFAVVTALGVVAVVGLETKKDTGSELSRNKMALEETKSASKEPAPVVAAAPVAPSADLPAAPAPSAAAEQGEAAAAMDSLAKAEAREDEKAVRAVQKPMPAAKVAQTKSAELADDMEMAKKIQATESKKKQKEAAYYEPPAEKARPESDAYPGNYRQADRAAAHATAKDLDYAKNDLAPRDVAVADKSGVSDNKGGGSFGLSAGSTASAAGPSGRVAANASPAPAKTEAPKAEREAPPAVAQMAAPQPQPSSPPAAVYGGSGTRGQAAMEPQQAATAPPPPPMNMPSQAQAQNRTSLGMGLRNNENQRGGDDGLATRRQVAQNYEADQKQAAADVQGLLKQAKTMDQQEQPQDALKLAMAAFNGGARDQQRMEALTYICKSLQRLDSPAAAQYCTMLNREFPNSDVGQAFVRNQMRPASSPSRAKKSGYREADEEMMKPTSEPATLSK